MEYINVEQAINRPGLRLVLTAGVPGPWGEAAKAILRLKNIPFTAVRQDGGAENAQLAAWTGQNSAPVAIYNDEAPRANSLDILYLAERINPLPALIPQDIDQRIEMFGLIQTIIGEQGFAWQRRLMLLQPLMNAPGREEMAARLGLKYGYTDEAAAQAALVCAAILTRLATHLRQQESKGSAYFVGSSLSAVDVYWANFAGMLKPLPAEVNPMPESLRKSYAELPPSLLQASDVILLQHRDYIYSRYLTLPLDY